MRHFLLLLLILGAYAQDDRRPLVKSPTNTWTEFPNGDTLRVAPRQGLDASKGTASSYTKCIYLATDTLKVYYSDGAVWTEISPTSTAFADNTFYLYDNGDVSKILNWQLGNQTTGTTVTVNTGAQTVNRQVSLPVLTGDRTLAVLDQAQTFTAHQTISTGLTAPYMLIPSLGGGAVNQYTLGTAGGPDGFYIYDDTAAAYRFVINDAGETILGTTTDAGAFRLQVSAAATGAGSSAAYFSATDADYSQPVVCASASSGGSLYFVMGGATSSSVPAWQNDGVLEYARSASDLHLSALNGNLLLDTGAARINRVSVSDTAVTTTVPIITPAATTSIPSIRLPHGTAPSSPTNGDMWTTTAGFYGRVNGATVGPFGTGGSGVFQNLFSSAAQTATVDTTASAYTIINSTGALGSLTIPANSLIAGSTIRVKFSGTLKTTGTPTLLVDFTVAGTSAVDINGTMVSTGGTLTPFAGEVVLQMRGVGASASANATMTMSYRNTTAGGSSDFGTSVTSGISQGAPTIDTTTTNVMNLLFTWGASSSSNGSSGCVITIDQVR